MLKTSQRSLFSQWIWYNLLGWLLGVFLGLGLGGFIIIPFLQELWGYVFVLEHGLFISSLFLWFPFGLCLASMQLSVLKERGIRSFYWLLTTALAWAVMAAMFRFVYYTPYITTSARATYFLFFVVILLGGAAIGTVQFVEMKKVISKPILWIVANSLGLFALGLIVFLIFVSVFSVNSYILNFLYANNLAGFVRARDLIMVIMITILLPFLSTLTVSGLTGWVIMKFPRFQSPELDNQAQSL